MTKRELQAKEYAAEVAEKETEYLPEATTVTCGNLELTETPDRFSLKIDGHEVERVTALTLTMAVGEATRLTVTVLPDPKK